MTDPLQAPEGVPESAWLMLARADRGRWAIAERNALGEVIGTAYRLPDGSKDFQAGGKRGLILPWPLPAYAGSSESDPLFVCEGASDTATLLGLGLDAVGVPMAGHCGAMLADLLAGRHAVIVSDADSAGIGGSDRLAAALAARCASVRIILPPLEAKDARQSAIAGADAGHFRLLAEAADPVPIPVAPPASTRTGNETGHGLTWVSIAELPPAVEVDWLWPGYLASGGITLLTGLWKSGKTTLLSHLLRDLYRGGGLVDASIDAPTLILSEESSMIWTARREALGLDPRIVFAKRVTFARPSMAEWTDTVGAFAEKVRTDGAALAVIDTLAGCWPVANENDASEVLAALSPLRDVSESGAAVLLVTHPRKGEGTNFTSARGSGALSGFPDVLVEFGRYAPEDAADTRRILRAVGRFDGTPAEQVLDYRPDGYVSLGERLAVGRADDLDTIAELLDSLGDWSTWERVRAAWPGPTRIGERRLRGLLNEGHGKGRWERRGMGVRNDPHRFRSVPEGSDSFPVGCETGPATGNESAPAGLADAG